MLNASNDGTYEGMRKTSAQENSTLTWKTTESVEGTTNPAMRETEVVSGEESVDSAGPPQIEGKQLVLLQVNWRSIVNKILEFCNLVHI